MRRFLPAVVVGSFALGLGCQPSTEGIVEADSVGVTSEDSGSDGCVVGQADCACTPGGGCDPGLACVAGLCTPEGSDSSDEDSGSEDSSSDTGACSALGCDCVPGPEACDPGLECIDGVCDVDNCGNMALDNGEQCDDGNTVDGDGCDNDCSYTEIVEISLGARHTCALIEGGRLRCWGEGFFGQLGYGNSNNVGDSESPASVGDVPLPGSAVEIDLGVAHSCGRFADGEVRCWGQNYYGQLGYGNVDWLGDNEALLDLAAIDVGGVAQSLTVGGNHACVRLDNGKLRCWGQNSYGELGLANTFSVGDDEVPGDAQLVFLGADAIAVDAGNQHNCAVTSDTAARCWGRADRGELGYGNNFIIGDNEPPSDAGDVSVVPPSLAGATLTQLALGREHSCVLLSTGDVLCWGRADVGQLGQGNNQDWGNQNGEDPSALQPISLGAAATAIAAGGDHSCALLTTGEVRCWGRNDYGQLGLGMNLASVGKDQLPDTVPVVDLGRDAIMIAAGEFHTCAVLDDYEMLCWGYNVDGRLGYGHTNLIGDNESPAVAGAIELL